MDQQSISEHQLRSREPRSDSTNLCKKTIAEQQSSVHEMGSNKFSMARTNNRTRKDDTMMDH